MNRIIISTSFNRLNILGDLQFNKNLNLLLNNLVVGFDNTIKEFTKNYDGCNIILIQENLKDEDSVKSLMINKETDFFLHHTNVNGLFEIQNTLFHENHIQKGAHEKNPKDIYFPLFTEIIFNDKLDDKVSSIIDRFFKSKKMESDTRIKLDFLYHIYNGGLPSKFEQKSDIPKLKELTSLYETFEDEKYKIQLDFDKDGSDGAVQRQKLSRLRDALLA